MVDICFYGHHFYPKQFFYGKILFSIHKMAVPNKRVLSFQSIDILAKENGSTKKTDKKKKF